MNTKIEKLIAERATIQKRIESATEIVKHINARFFAHKPEPSSLQLPPGWSINEESLERAKLAVSEAKFDLFDLDDELEPLLMASEIESGHQLAVATQYSAIEATFTTALNEVTSAKTRLEAASSALERVYQEAQRNVASHIEERRAANLPPPPSWPKRSSMLGDSPIGVPEFLNGEPKRDTSRRRSHESGLRRQRAIVAEYDEHNRKIAEAAEQRRKEAAYVDSRRDRSRLPGFLDIVRVVIGDEKVSSPKGVEVAPRRHSRTA